MIQNSSQPLGLARIRCLLTAIALAITAVRFLVFPASAHPPPGEVVIDIARLVSAAIAYGFIMRLRHRWVEFGWGLLVCALLNDLLAGANAGARLSEALFQGGLELAAPVAIPAGLIDAFRSHHTRATHLEKAEHTAQIGEGQFKSLFDEAPFALWEEDWSGLKRRLDQRRNGSGDPMDAAGFRELAGAIQIVAANRAARCLFPSGWDAPDKTLEPFSQEALRPVFEEALRALRNKEPEFTRDLLADRGDEGLRRLHLRLQIEPGHEADWSRVLVSVVDLTEARNSVEARRALQAKNREVRNLQSLGTLAGGVAHDFNNLLTVIIGNANLARQSGDRPSVTDRCLGEIESAAEQAAALCDKMLAYSGRGRFEMKPVSLNALLKSACRSSADSAKRPQPLQLHLAERLPEALGDAEQLERALSGFLDNAIESLGDAGGITVRTGETRIDAAFNRSAMTTSPLPRGDYVYAEVRDEGCGMTPQELESIFEPFFTTKFPGRGLSLSAAQGIASAHHGAVQVESVKGRGSTFRLLLPVAATTRGNRPASPEVTGYLRRPRALVADNDPLICRAMRQMLNLCGWDATTVGDGADAIATYADDADAYGIVFLDWDMPHVDGDEAARRILAEHPDAQVVIMTGFDRSEALTNLGDTPIAGFLSKPFGVTDLRGIVNQAAGTTPAPLAAVHA